MNGLLVAHLKWSLFVSLKKVGSEGSFPLSYLGSVLTTVSDEGAKLANL